MLTQLIPELLGMILALLDVPDFYSLRLTSRQLEQVSRAAFGAAAFSKLRLDLRTPNLSWLSDISSHDDFRHAVREWHIGHWQGRASASKLSLEMSPAADGHWRRLPSKSLDLSFEPVTEIVRLLLRFPNCTGVTMTDEIELWQYFFLTPDGATYDLRGFHPRDAVELILHAFSAPGAPPLRHFRMRMTKGLDEYYPGKTSCSTVASVRGNLSAHLQELVLQYVPHDDDNLARMLELLTSASRLRTLRLMWVSSPGRDAPGFALGRHLEDHPGFRPPLETLGLGGISLAESDLLRLFSACRNTLKTLDFYLMKLTSGCWTNILKHLYATPFPKLRRLSMFKCIDGIDGQQIMDFCPLWADRGLQASCGSTFEFGRDVTGQGSPRPHIAGFLFEAGRGTSDMKLALRACVEGSHRYSSTEANVPCMDIDGLGEVPGLLPPDSPDKPAREYERWLGLPMTMRDVEMSQLDERGSP